MVLDELTGKPGVFFEMSTQVRAALDLIEKVVKRFGAERVKATS
jgi:hypothetical protein